LGSWFLGSKSLLWEVAEWDALKVPKPMHDAQPPHHILHPTQLRLLHFFSAIKTSAPFASCHSEPLGIAEAVACSLMLWPGLVDHALVDRRESDPLHRQIVIGQGEMILN